MLADDRPEAGGGAGLSAAAELYEGLLAKAPADPECRADLAGTLNNLGNVIGKLGQAEDQEACYRRSIGLSEALAAEFPDQPGHRAASS